MFRALTVAAVVAIAATAVPASAAEFSGFRAELQGGWDHPSVNYDVNDNAGTFQGQYYVKHSGFMYGAEAGYDFAVSPTVILGVLGSVSGTTVKLQSEVVNNLYNASGSVGLNWNLAARAGFKVADSTLIYGAGGYASTKIKYYIDNPTTPALSYETNRTYGGFLLAAGVEQAFGEKFYGKVEYRYSNYQSGVHRNDVVFGAGMRF